MQREVLGMSVPVVSFAVCCNTGSTSATCSAMLLMCKDCLDSVSCSSPVPDTCCANCKTEARCARM